MTSNTIKDFIHFLENLAFYNDKGFEWSGHTDQELTKERQKAQNQILLYIEKIGEHAFPLQLLEALKNGEVISDFSGKYVEVTKQALLKKTI